MKMKIVYAVLFVLCFSLGYACSDEGDTLDNTIDCYQLCQNYEQCVAGDGWDTSECADLCESKGDVDESFAQSVDACEECIDDKTCSEQGQCAEECRGVTYSDEDDCPGIGNTEQLAECAEVCGKYEQCENQDLDTTQCTRSCEDHADANCVVAAMVDACEACMDDQACVEWANCDSCNDLPFEEWASDDN